MNICSKAVSIFFATMMVPLVAVAEPTSEAVSIISLRPYIGSNVVFVYTTTSLCANPFYSIDLSSNGGKGAYAAALSALAAGKMVKLEILAAGCNTGPSGSTVVQSLYISQ